MTPAITLAAIATITAAGMSLFARRAPSRPTAFRWASRVAVAGAGLAAPWAASAPYAAYMVVVLLLAVALRVTAWGMTPASERRLDTSRHATVGRVGSRLAVWALLAVVLAWFAGFPVVAHSNPLAAQMGDVRLLVGHGWWAGAGLFVAGAAHSVSAEHSRRAAEANRKRIADYRTVAGHTPQKGH